MSNLLLCSIHGIGSDLLKDADVFSRHLCIDQPDISDWSTVCGRDVRLASVGSLLQKLLNEDRFEDEIIAFLRNTSIGNRKCDLLERWKLHHFPSVPSVAHDILPFQATTVRSDSSLSFSGNLVADDGCRLGNEAITSCILLGLWS